MVTVAQLCEYTKNHWAVHLRKKKRRHLWQADSLTVKKKMKREKQQQWEWTRDERQPYRRTLRTFHWVKEARCTKGHIAWCSTKCKLYMKSPERQIHRDRKQISGCQGKGGRLRRVTASGAQGFLLGQWRISGTKGWWSHNIGNALNVNEKTTLKWLRW